MKIEHFKCQDKYEDLQLSYANLLAACTGNEGQPARIQTCDTRKGSLELSLHPCHTLPNCDIFFKYTPDGRITCVDEKVQEEIDTVLNLNNQSLQDMRAEVYDQVSKIVEDQSKKLKNRQIKLKYFQTLLNEWITPDINGRLKPFCMVAVSYLNKKIRHCQN